MNVGRFQSRLTATLALTSAGLFAMVCAGAAVAATKRSRSPTEPNIVSAHLLRDINSRPASSYPDSFGSGGGKIFFGAEPVLDPSQYAGSSRPPVSGQNTAFAPRHTSRSSRRRSSCPFRCSRRAAIAGSVGSSVRRLVALCEHRGE